MRQFGARVRKSLSVITRPRCVHSKDPLDPGRRVTFQPDHDFIYLSSHTLLLLLLPYENRAVCSEMTDESKRESARMGVCGISIWD